MTDTAIGHRLHLRGDARVAARRNNLFRETPLEQCERWALGAAYALKPGRAAGLPSLALLWLNDLVSPQHKLPDPTDALENPPGLCGIARDLSVPTLLAAYRRGLFPGGHIAPAKWFSPAERCVLFFDELRIEKSLRRLMRKGCYRVTFDRDFERVIKACAGRRPGKWHVTWITPRIMRAYADLFDAGYAHSYEVWNEAGDLAGGGYGVAIGSAFFGESQFSLERSTSKLGQIVLAWHLAKWGFAFDDSKWASPMLRSMGFRTIPRDEFLTRVSAATMMPTRRGAWAVETDVASLADWRPGASRTSAETVPVMESPTTAPTHYGRTLVPLLPAFDPVTLGLTEALLTIL